MSNDVKPTTKDDRRKQRGRRHLLNLIYICLIACCVLVFSWTGYAASYIYPLLWGDLTGEDDYVAAAADDAVLTGKLTILLMGCDHRKNEETGRSDTLMVAFIDLDKKLIRLLSIPRDSYVEVPGHGNTKINHAYAYGGVELTTATLVENFGIVPNYYVNVDFQAFRDVIDAVGGVTIDVPKKLYNPVETIDLDPGLQHLDGKQALQFVRFRDEEGDEGRVHRQQQFMVALKDQLTSAGTMLQIPDLSRAITDNVVTDIPGATLLKLLMTLGTEVTLETYQPAGEGAYMDGVSYYFIYETQREAFFRSLTDFQDTVAVAAEVDDDTSLAAAVTKNNTTEGDKENGSDDVTAN